MCVQMGVRTSLPSTASSHVISQSLATMGRASAASHGPTSSQPPSTGEAACLMVYSGVLRPSQPISTRRAHAQVGVRDHQVHRGATGAPTVVS